MLVVAKAQQEMMGWAAKNHHLLLWPFGGTLYSPYKNVFPVDSDGQVTGHDKGWPLSQVLFLVFMDRISRCSQAPEESTFGPPAFQLFADDVVLLASWFSNRKQCRSLSGLVERSSLTWSSRGLVHE